MNPQFDLDWRAMFAKYIDVVGSNEGVHFLYAFEWTQPEWEAILVLYDEVHIPKGWAPFSDRERKWQTL